MRNAIKQRISAFRKFMEEKKLDAFIIPSTDPHLSEYPASHWMTREWISGFTGSAGTIVVTRTKVGLWTDSRYYLQASDQLRGTEIILFKDGLSNVPSIDEWLISELSAGNTVGIDGNVYPSSEAKDLIFKLNKKKIHLLADYDPFADIWIDRPSIPTNPIFIYPHKYNGINAAKKIKDLRDEIAKHGANSILISSIDTIAWLFNIRGNDVKCNPVVVSYAYVSFDEAVLFVNPQKLDRDIAHYLQMEGVTIADYEKVFDFIKVVKEDAIICLQSNKVSFNLYNAIPSHCRVIDIQSPADLMKSKKNETELECVRNAMEKDGVALVRFLMWFEKALSVEDLDELKVSQKLYEFRNQQDLFVGDSFDAIVGYAANGAIVHYHVTPESTAKINTDGFLLIDSGAQYLDGTTDITRTLSLGNLSQQMKEDYTLVLKGHIGIATCIYPEGTRGSQIDILGRRHLWNKGLNYLHGTGHGVGHFLNVHEGPQNIRMNENSTTLQVGMITSNEPGIYRTNQYGIRIENLLLTREEMVTEFGKFYSFETLSLFPIDTTPILKKMLTDEEIMWLNNYHQFVYDRLSPSLDDLEKTWLKEKTKAI